MQGLNRDEEVLLAGIEHVNNIMKNQVKPVDKICTIKNHMKMGGLDLVNTGDLNQSFCDIGRGFWGI